MSKVVSFIRMIGLFFIFTGYIDGQEVRFENSEVFFSVAFDYFSNDSAVIRLRLKNRSSIPIFIYPIEEANLADRYATFIGVGFYSHIQPFMPDHFAKYERHFYLMAIQPGEIIEKEGRGWVRKNVPIRIHLDYYVGHSRRYLRKDRIRINGQKYRREMKKVRIISIVLKIADS